MAKITISLPEGVIQEGKQFADRKGATFSGLIRISLKEKLKNDG